MTCLEIEITRCYGRLRSKAIEIAGSIADGEDLLQDVLAQSIRSGNADRVACIQERKGSFFFYIYRAMFIHYRGTKQKAAKKKVRFVELVDLPDTTDEVEYDLEGEQFDVMLDWISPYEKELIQLSLKPGFKRAIVAEIIGLPTETVERDLRKAKKKLIQYDLSKPKS